VNIGPADTGSSLLQRTDTDDPGRIIETEIHLTERQKLFRANRALSARP
jgi:hypothetical protein